MEAAKILTDWVLCFQRWIIIIWRLYNLKGSSEAKRLVKTCRKDIKVKDFSIVYWEKRI